MTILLNWANDKNTNPIIMTVALPILNGEKIVWLALEGLRRQINIDFNWELII